MFQKICIKDAKTSTSNIDIEFLIDTMFYYGKVIVLVHRKELNNLFAVFGEDTLKQLIISGRLDLRFRNNMFGAIILPNGQYGIDTFSSNDVTLNSILYQIHREKVNNSIKNTKFAKEFTDIIGEFTYPKDFPEIVTNEFQDVNLLKKKLPLYFDYLLPGFQLPEKLEIEISKSGKFEPFDSYSLNSNIDLLKFNEQYKNKNPKTKSNIDYSGFLLALGEAKGDLYISSELESEIVTSEIYSRFMTTEIEEIVKKRIQSQDEISLFQKYTLDQCHSLGFAFTNGIISSKELLRIFEKSEKFRYWLENISEDDSLLGEYNKAVLEKDLSDKIPTKLSRFAIFEGLGATLDLLGAGGLGTITALGISAFDNFVLDKLINQKWKPNQFIDKTLKPKLKKSSP